MFGREHGRNKVRIIIRGNMISRLHHICDVEPIQYSEDSVGNHDDFLTNQSQRVVVPLQNLGS